MKKNYLFIGAAAIMMAGCASDDIVGDENISSGETPIAFSMNTPNATRGTSTNPETNAADAVKLNREFIVWGEKGESDAATSLDNNTNIVFENYRVQYSDEYGSTKNSTVSNTTGWDYVGITPYITNVTPNIGSGKTQTIKYWDFNKTYTFTAVSALNSDITGGKVTIKKNNDGSTKKTHGYTITLTNGADASQIFVADRQEKSFANGTAVQPIKMAFRQFQTKVRFGFYETVPGYDVKITGVKYNSASEPQTTFGVDGNFVKNPAGTSDVITYTITYDDSNKPVLNTTQSGTTSDSYKTFGNYVFGKALGKTSKTATFDKVSDTSTSTDGEYTAILPNTGNSTAMTFKVSYKLISEDTGEEIAITDRQVTVPAVYCQWKPNFAYTYLFKVSDASAELYPITFDAVVEADEVSCQETITEVAGDETKVCITTIGFDGNTVVKSTTADEYSANNTIYASVTKGDAVETLSIEDGSTNIALYTITGDQTITEASVANCIKYGQLSTTGGKDKVVTGLNNKTMTATPVDINTGTTSVPCIVTAVPKEDGNGDRNISALKFTPAAGTYAIEYTTGSDKYYKIVIVK